MIRFVRGVACLLAGATLVSLPGCVGKLDRSDELKTALKNTERLARSFVYSEISNGHTSTVSGQVADDLRYTATYTLDGLPAMSEVDADDARAMQIADPGLLSRLQSQIGNASASAGGATPLVSGAGPAATPPPMPSPSPTVDPGLFPVVAPEKAPPDAASVANLQQGRWVIDPTGARAMVKPKFSGKVTQLGDDQILDALTALTYVHDAVIALGQGGVALWNPQALTYDKALDPFPPPDHLGGETRFDVLVNQLGPRPTTGTQADKEASIPGDTYYRVMAIYVRNGLVQKVRESISIERRLKDPRQDIMLRIADYQPLPPGMANAPPSVQAAFVLQVVNRIHARRSLPLLREREMSLDFSGLGNPQAINLPANAVKGNLISVFPRGQVLAQAT